MTDSELPTLQTLFTRDDEDYFLQMMRNGLGGRDAAKECGFDFDALRRHKDERKANGDFYLDHAWHVESAMKSGMSTVNYALAQKSVLRTAILTSQFQDKLRLMIERAEPGDKHGDKVLLDVLRSSVAILPTERNDQAVVAHVQAPKNLDEMDRAELRAELSAEWKAVKQLADKEGIDVDFDIND